MKDSQKKKQKGKKGKKTTKKSASQKPARRQSSGTFSQPAEVREEKSKKSDESEEASGSEEHTNEELQGFYGLIDPETKIKGNEARILGKFCTKKGLIRLPVDILKRKWFFVFD